MSSIKKAERNEGKNVPKKTEKPEKPEKDNKEGKGNVNMITKYSTAFKQTREEQNKLNVFITSNLRKIETTTNVFGKLKVLGGILNEIKRSYQDESKTIMVLGNETNWEDLKNDNKPIYKILLYFRTQIIVRKYIKYSVEYINNLQNVFTPEILQKIRNELEKLQTEQEVFMIEKAGDSENIPFTEDNNRNLNANKYMNSNNNREIIIKMLKEYDINYNGGDSEKILLDKLKAGLEEIVNFVVTSINSAPAAMDSLAKLSDIHV